MRRTCRVLVAGSVLLLLLAACGKEKDTGFNHLPKAQPSSGGGGGAGGIQIAAGNKFEPATFQAKVGQAVTWTYSDSSGQPHNVEADDGSFNSSPDCQKDPTKCLGQSGQPSSFSFTFKKAGKYPYFCAIHGAKGGIGMSAIVEVS